MYFFKHAHQSSLEEMDNLIGEDIVIRQAFWAIDQASWSEEELRTYEKFVKTELDNLAVEEQKIEDAEAKEKAEGKAELIKMIIKKQGRTIKQIMGFIGLTKEEIDKLEEYVFYAVL